MANTIKIKRKTTTGAPLLANLSDGEFCFVVPDNSLYLRVDAATLLNFSPSVEISQAAYDALSPPLDNVTYKITS